MKALYLLYPGIGMRGIKLIARVGAATIVNGAGYVTGTAVQVATKDTVLRSV